MRLSSQVFMGCVNQSTQSFLCILQHLLCLLKQVWLIEHVTLPAAALEGPLGIFNIKLRRCDGAGVSLNPPLFLFQLLMERGVRNGSNGACWKKKCSQCEPQRVCGFKGVVHHRGKHRQITNWKNHSISSIVESTLNTTQVIEKCTQHIIRG